MANRKPVFIDGELTHVDANCSLAQVVPDNVQSVTTGDGRIIRKSDFARTPAPDRYNMNLSGINKGHADFKRGGEI